LEAYAEWLLALVTEQPDLTLDEIVTTMRKRRIPGSRTAVWRFFERHNLTFKKSPARRRTTTARRGTRTPTLEESAAHAEPRSAGVHRRNGQQYQHGAA
jgi:transposase